MKTASSETVIETMVKPICFAPSSAASSGVSPALDEARDVLGHHDGVVDDEARRDRERHQRQVVEAVAEQVHDAEGADERQRHGDARDRASRARCAGRRRRPATTRTTLSTSVLSTSCTEARMVCVRSMPTSMSMAGEIDARELGQERRSRARLVSMMFAPGWRRMMRSTARLPSTQPATRLFSTSSKTRGDVAEPHGGAALVRDDERRVGRRRRRADRWRRSRAPASRPPSAALRLVGGRWPRARRARPRGRGRARRARRGSTCTRTAGCWPPPTNTCPTPSTCEIFCARTVFAASNTCASGSVSRGEREDEDRRVGRVDLPVRRLERQVRAAARRRRR